MTYWMVENKIVLIAEKDLNHRNGLINLEYKSRCVISGLPIIVRMDANQFGYVATKNVVRTDDWIVTDRGIAFKSLGHAKLTHAISLAPSNYFWNKVKAYNLGDWADDTKPSDLQLDHMARAYKDLVAHTIEELAYNHAYKYDFKRIKRPLVRLLDQWGNITTAVFLELYTDQPGRPRVAVVTGVNNSGLGGYIAFIDNPELL